MTAIAGCRIELLDGAASRSWLEWLLGRGPAPRTLAAPAWVLAHSDGGVTWGLMEDGAWRLASDIFPDFCPRIGEAEIQELRVFSRREEVMIWRSDNGLRGRVLHDEATGDIDKALRPADEDRLLLANRTGEHKSGFTRVGDGAGAEQALPLYVTGDPPVPWPRLRVRHYFARDEKTGAVRIAVTRLVEVK